MLQNLTSLLSKLGTRIFLLENFWSTIRPQCVSYWFSSLSESPHLHNHCNWVCTALLINSPKVKKMHVRFFFLIVLPVSLKCQPVIFLSECSIPWSYCVSMSPEEQLRSKALSPESCLFEAQRLLAYWERLGKCWTFCYLGSFRQQTE